MAHERKTDHLNMAEAALVSSDLQDQRFNYEPMFTVLPDQTDWKYSKRLTFLGKELKSPIWISSMTGDTKESIVINENLARVANEHGLGMGLGSCRLLLQNPKLVSGFNLRPIIGKELPLYANLGIAQIEDCLKKHQLEKIEEVVSSLDADGLIIHVNPLQEWFQEEGDVISIPPIETISEFLSKTKLKTIVKEVGQGMGPKSLKALIQLPLAAIEFAGFGGTNFSKLELQRQNNKEYLCDPLVNVGHTAQEMIKISTSVLESLGEDALCKEFIVSGGIQNFLDGFFLIKTMKANCVYGQAATFLKYAGSSYQELSDFVARQVKGLVMADACFDLRK